MLNFKLLIVCFLLITGFACSTTSKNHFSTSTSTSADLPPDKLSELGRYIIKKERIYHLVSQNGRLVFDKCINREGRIIRIECNEEYTTITDKDMINDIFQVASKIEFSKDETADPKQCGHKIFILKGF